MHSKSTLLNGRLAHVVTTLRYGEAIVVADAGLPVPSGVETLDLALVPGVPSLQQVLEALKANLILLEVWVAEEMKPNNESRYDMVHAQFGELVRDVPHLEIEDRLPSVRLIIQTGEVTPYGNVVLLGGLEFFDIDMSDA